MQVLHKKMTTLGLGAFFDSAGADAGTYKPSKIGIRFFIAERILPHHPDSEKFRGSSLQYFNSPKFSANLCLSSCPFKLISIQEMNINDTLKRP